MCLSCNHRNSLRTQGRCHAERFLAQQNRCSYLLSMIVREAQMPESHADWSEEEKKTDSDFPDTTSIWRSQSYLRYIVIGQSLRRKTVSVLMPAMP
jgi:hypothetical protein